MFVLIVFLPIDIQDAINGVHKSSQDPSFGQELLRDSNVTFHLLDNVSLLCALHGFWIVGNVDPR